LGRHRAQCRWCLSHTQHERLLILQITVPEHNMPRIVRRRDRNGPWATCRGLSTAELLSVLQGHVLLLDLDHLRIQLHQAVDWVLPATTSGPHQMEAISYWHARSAIPELLEPGHSLTRPTVFIAIFTVGSTFAIIFQCIPVQAGYDFTLRPPAG
jgi:hypothetical protein